MAPPPGRAAVEPDLQAVDGSEIRLLAAGAQGATRASLCEVRLAPGRPAAAMATERAG